MPGASWDVLVVDRYGVLTDMYRLADIVVMGGTFHPKVGGHNILEATALGKPVIIGPHTYSITAQVELLASVDGLHACASGEELAAHMLALAGDRERCAQIGAAALRATLAQRGAAKRAVEQVLTLFSE
jgi:3-deoxy-D-manno-octulosonic-acid transferase